MKGFAGLACAAFLAPGAHAQYSVLRPNAPKVPALTTPPAAGSFQMGADDCASPHTFIGIGEQLGVPFTTGTTGTTGQSEANCNAAGTTGIANDVWFGWTADMTGTGRITTCGGSAVDTKIAVWPDNEPSSCPADGTALACNDDTCGVPATVTWPVTSGTTYTFQLGTFPGAAGGSGTFHVTQVPPLPCGQYDDGSTENALGLTAGGELGWMHAFNCLASVGGVRTAYSTIMWPGGCGDGNGSKVAVWEDADCDGDPNTGMVLLEVVQTLVVNCGTDILNPISFSQSHPIPSGCSWIAASADQVAGEFPGPMDQSVSVPEAWLVGSTSGPGTLDYNDLSNNTYPPLQMEAIGFPGAWLLRASGSEGCGVPPTLCSGDGSAAPCGCGNEVPPDSCTGCLNGLGVGARLSASGNASLSNDTLIFAASSVTAQPGLFFQGNQTIGSGGGGVTFGDGIRCCGSSVIRLEIAFGQQPEPTSVSTTIVISQHPQQSLSPGDSRCYQYWYRDPAGSPCGSNFNLTNALLVTWLP